MKTKNEIHLELLKNIPKEIDVKEIANPDNFIGSVTTTSIMAMELMNNISTRERIVITYHAIKNIIETERLFAEQLKEKL